MRTTSVLSMSGTLAEDAGGERSTDADSGVRAAKRARVSPGGEEARARETAKTAGLQARRASRRSLSASVVTRSVSSAQRSLSSRGDDAAALKPKLRGARAAGCGGTAGPGARSASDGKSSGILGGTALSGLAGVQQAQEEWSVPGSQAALRTTNPIRAVVDKLNPRLANPELNVLSLSIGDPTAHGHMRAHPAATQALVDAVQNYCANGYPPMIGLERARSAVARQHSTCDVVFKANDVVMTNGCSHALQMCLTALAEPAKSNVLVPSPGFSLYKTLCQNLGVEAREYQLDSSRDWALDVGAIAAAMDNDTAAIILNSPSNPTGAVHSDEEVMAVLRLCEAHRVTVVADEIYHSYVFRDTREEGGTAAAKSASAAELNVGIGAPLLCLGGLSKRFLVPGWCLGWILVHDPRERLAEIRVALEKLSSLIVGPHAAVQYALPDILNNVPESWHEGNIYELEQQAHRCHTRISKIPGLSASRPRGSMFMLVKIDPARLQRAGGVVDGVDFAAKLFREQSVVVLPGEVFGAPGHFRITYAAPTSVLEEALSRIELFCAHHAV